MFCPTLTVCISCLSKNSLRWVGLSQEQLRKHVQRGRLVQNYTQSSKITDFARLKLSFGKGLEKQAGAELCQAKHSLS